jgi:hypothetical protein
MTLEEIKAAVLAGHMVCWKQANYVVQGNEKQGFCIVCTNNNHATGLTWIDGVTLNGVQEDFYIHELARVPVVNPALRHAADGEGSDTD